MDAILKNQAEKLAHEIADKAATRQGLNGLTRSMLKTALERNRRGGRKSVGGRRAAYRFEVAIAVPQRADTKGPKTF